VASTGPTQLDVTCLGNAWKKYMLLHKRHFKSAVVLNSVIDTLVVVCKLYMNPVTISFCNAVK